MQNGRVNVIKYGKTNGVLIEAYSPVAHGAILNDPTIARWPSNTA